MKLPAWVVRGEKPQLDGVKINKEGLTFQEWLDAAEIVAIRPDVRHEYVAAWERGEDPTEYRNPEKKPRRGLKMSDDLDGVTRVKRRDGTIEAQNDEGLSFEEWLAAAGISEDVFEDYETVSQRRLIREWERGVDPAEHRVGRPPRPKTGLKMDDDLDGVHGKRRR